MERLSFSPTVHGRIAVLMAEVQLYCRPKPLGSIKRLCPPTQRDHARVWNGPNGIRIVASQLGLLNVNQSCQLAAALDRIDQFDRDGQVAVQRLVHYLFHLRKADYGQGRPWPGHLTAQERRQMSATRSTDQSAAPRRERLGYFVHQGPTA